MKNTFFPVKAGEPRVLFVRAKALALYRWGGFQGAADLKRRKIRVEVDLTLSKCRRFAGPRSGSVVTLGPFGLFCAALCCLGCLGCSGLLWAVLDCSGRPLEAHFEHFWGLLAKWLSGGPWRLILSISEACWPNGSQETPGGSF